MLRQETMPQASGVDIQTHIKNQKREQGIGRDGKISSQQSPGHFSVHGDCWPNTNRAAHVGSWWMQGVAGVTIRSQQFSLLPLWHKGINTALMKTICYLLNDLRTIHTVGRGGIILSQPPCHIKYTLQHSSLSGSYKSYNNSSAYLPPHCTFQVFTKKRTSYVFKIAWDMTLPLHPDSVNGDL